MFIKFIINIYLFSIWVFSHLLYSYKASDYFVFILFIYSILILIENTDEIVKNLMYSFFVLSFLRLIIVKDNYNLYN